jgi:hypothetical protein
VRRGARDLKDEYEYCVLYYVAYSKYSKYLEYGVVSNWLAHGAKDTRIRLLRRMELQMVARRRSAMGFAEVCVAAPCVGGSVAALGSHLLIMRATGARVAARCALTCCPRSTFRRSSVHANCEFAPRRIRRRAHDFHSMVTAERQA